jgi:hypothetical protein
MKEKILTINFGLLNRKLQFLLIFLGAVILLPMVLGSEDLEVRTYYPFPYGSYHNITASDYMMLGGDDNWQDRMIVGNIEQTVPVVRNFQGIESARNVYLQSALAVNIGSNIQLDVPGKSSVLGRFCVWTRRANPQCSNMKNGVKKWQPVMLARRVSANNYRTYYNKVDQNSQFNFTEHNHPSLGRVLCCRVEDTSR